MELEQVAEALKELGQARRLAVYKELAKYGEQGVPVGHLQEVLGIPASTLSHHLQRLMRANLVSQRREGRELYCSVQVNTFNGIIAFLQSECCSK